MYIYICIYICIYIYVCVFSRAPLSLDLLMVVGKKHFPNHGLMVISDYLLWSRVKNHLKQKCMNKSQIYNHMGMCLNEATLITHLFPRKKTSTFWWKKLGCV